MTAGRSTDSDPRTARRRAAAFVLVSLALSWAWDAWIITHGGMARIWAVGLAMWIPGLTSLGLRLLTGEGLGDVGWKPGRGAAWAWACLAPVACAVFTYALAVAVGIVHFGQPAALGSLPLSTDSALLAWFQIIALSSTVHVPRAVVFALGEELGWRGYLVPRLVEGTVPRPFLLNGVVWGLYHVPLIVWGDYATSAHPLVSAALFLVLTVLLGTFLAWLRMSSGSLWPPVLAHAVHNLYYLRIFEPWFQGPLRPYFAGEQGVFSLLAYGLLVLWLHRRGAFASRSPWEARASAVVAPP